MTRYFIYEMYYSSAHEQQMYACDFSVNVAAIIDEYSCVCYSTCGNTESYHSASTIGLLASGKYTDGRILLETTSIEEFLESEYLSLVDHKTVDSIRRVCL